MRNLAVATTVTALIFGGCSSTQKAGPAPAAQIALEVDRVMPLPESLDASAIEVTLKVENLTKERQKISAIRYTIDTKDVGGVIEGSANSDASIEPEQVAELKFRQSIPFPKEEAAYREVLDRRTIPIEMKGTVEFESGAEADFEKITQVATPTLPRFIVHDAQAARYGKEGLDVTLFLRLVNDNVFPVLIQGVSYTVSIGGKQVKSEQAAVGVRLIAGGAEEYEVGQVLEAKTFDKDALKQILAERKITYVVAGKTELDRLTIPFEHTGEIVLATGE